MDEFDELKTPCRIEDFRFQNQYPTGIFSGVDFSEISVGIGLGDIY